MQKKKTANTMKKNCLSCELSELFLMRTAGAVGEEHSMVLCRHCLERGEHNKSTKEGATQRTTFADMGLLWGVVWEWKRQGLEALVVCYAAIPSRMGGGGVIS